MKIVTKKTIKKECFNLDFELIIWLNEHLKAFYETTKRDLKANVIVFKNRKMTLEKAIQYLIEITDKIKANYFDCINVQQTCDLTKEMYSILEEIHFYLWW